MKQRVTDPTDHQMLCDICTGPLTACFNRDSRVAWAECFAGGHHFVQNIFTPASRHAVTIDGVTHGYTFIEVPEDVDA